MKGGNILAIALRRAPMGKKKDPEGDAEETDEPDDKGGNMGLEAAMGDFIKAVKAGDNEAAAKAFEEAHEMCGNYDDKDDEEE